MIPTEQKHKSKWHHTFAQIIYDCIHDLFLFVTLISVTKHWRIQWPYINNCIKLFFEYIYSIHVKVKTFHINRSTRGNEIFFQTLPSQYDHLFYRILLEAAAKRYFVSQFEYRPNPRIGKITSGTSIPRLVAETRSLYVNVKGITSEITYVRDNQYLIYL